jgi:hypothetical protein
MRAAIVEREHVPVLVHEVPSISAGAYPNVLTPAFAVPSSILLHLLSLRQLIRRSVKS